MAFPVGARTNIPSRHAYPDGLTLMLYPQTTGRPHFAGRPQRRHKRNDFPGMQRHMYGDSSKSTSYSALECEYTPMRQLPLVGSTTCFISHHTQDFSAALHKNDDRAFDMTHRQSHAVGGMQRSTSTPWKELTVHGALDKPPQARLQIHRGVQFRLQVRRVIRDTVKRASTSYCAFARTPMEVISAETNRVLAQPRHGCRESLVSLPHENARVGFGTVQQARCRVAREGARQGALALHSHHVNARGLCVSKHARGHACPCYTERLPTLILPAV